MSENEQTPNQVPNNNSNQGPQGPGKPKLPLPKKPFKPRFTIYWVWGFILVALIIIEAVSNMNFSVKEVNFQYFQDSLLNNHYVDKIAVVNNDVAEITLKPEALKLAKFKDLPHTPPQFKINILDRQTFHQDKLPCPRHWVLAAHKTLMPHHRPIVIFVGFPLFDPAPGHWPLCNRPVRFVIVPLPVHQ